MEFSENLDFISVVDIFAKMKIRCKLLECSRPTRPTCMCHVCTIKYCNMPIYIIAVDLLLNML